MAVLKNYNEKIFTKESLMSKEDEFLSIESSTILKGIAIICIVVSHICTPYTRLTTPLGGIGVAIFLILSGYGLERSYQNDSVKSMKCWWRKRIIAVWIPYMIINLATFSLWGHWTLKDFIMDILLIRPRFGLGWYLNYLLVWYILFWSTHIFPFKTNKSRLIWMSAFALIFAGINTQISDLRFEQSFSFIMGMLAAIYLEKQPRRSYIKADIVTSIIGFVMLAIKQIPTFRNLLIIPGD